MAKSVFQSVRGGQPKVAIVGRPNVGKSSLFNAIVGRRLAIVHEESGVTRDRVTATVSHCGRIWRLIDTGGLSSAPGEKRSGDVWEGAITSQVEAALAEADVLLLVVSVQDGLHFLDEAAAERLRRTGKTVLVAVNKCDNAAGVDQAVEFARLGFPALFPVSCLHRRGLGQLLDAVAGALPEVLADAGAAETDPPSFSIAVLGRPNVGKSSLVNALLGEERVMVSDTAGTTRDAVDIAFAVRRRGETLSAVLVDTAGLRRRGKVDTAVERFSVMRAQHALSRCDVALLVLEANPDGATAQDCRIADLVERSGRGCVLVLNKWDLWRNRCPDRVLETQLRRTLPGMNYAPAVLTSASERRHLDMLWDTVAEVLDQTRRRISTGMLNRALTEAFARRTPPVIGAAPLKLYYASMTGIMPPRFRLFVNDPQYCAPNYLAYLRNALREAFDFRGLPLRLELRPRPKKVTGIHTPGGDVRAVRGAGSKTT